LKSIFEKNNRYVYIIHLPNGNVKNVKNNFEIVLLRRPNLGEDPDWWRNCKKNLSNLSLELFCKLCSLEPCSAVLLIGNL
jgi:hypothetical protein